jgi:hypothetical protein
VPRADEVDLGVGECLADHGLVGSKHVLDLVHDQALAGRAALVQAQVRIGVTRAMPVQHADVVGAVPDDAPLAVGELRNLGDEDFSHFHTPCARRHDDRHWLSL